LNRLKEYFPVLSVFFLALLVRLAYNLTLGYIPKYDAALYDHIARHLISEHCFCLYAHQPTISRAPLWPFILAIIYFFTGQHVVYARIFYCFLDAGTCVIIYLFAQDLFGRRTALITGVIASIYTGLFIYTGWLFTETLYTFCLMAFTYSIYRFQCTTPPTNPIEEKHQQKVHWLWIIFSGIFLGLAALTRPNGPILFTLLSAWALIVILAKIMPWQRVIKAVLLIAIIAAALLAPWTYRNYLVTHTFVPVAIGMGDVMVGAYNDTVITDNPIGPGLWVSPDRIKPPLPVALQQDHDAYNYTPENDNLATDYALHWIRTHVSSMPYLLSLHFINMWMPYTFEPGLPVKEFPNQLPSQVIWSMMLVMPFPVFLLAALGLLVTWKHWKKELLMVYLVIVMTIAQNLAFYGNIRFRAPIEPLLVLLVGGTIWWLTAKSAFSFSLFGNPKHCHPRS
jgi:4-amino-4-deoxy-L-arabinose transferase-like glycosyltransferase